MELISSAIPPQKPIVGESIYAVNEIKDSRQAVFTGTKDVRFTAV